MEVPNAISCCTSDPNLSISLYECGDARISIAGKTRRFKPTKHDYYSWRRLIWEINITSVEGEKLVHPART